MNWLFKKAEMTKQNKAKQQFEPEHAQYDIKVPTNQKGGNSVSCSLVNLEIPVKYWESCTLQLLDMTILDFQTVS